MDKKIELMEWVYFICIMLALVIISTQIAKAKTEIIQQLDKCEEVGE
jgi:hypothetical protein